MRSFSIEEPLSRLRERIELSSHVDGRQLPSFRILFGFFLLCTGIPDSAWVGDAPDGFFSPPRLSLANLFDGFPPRPLFTAADYLSVCCAACILLGIKARVAATLLFVVIITTSSFRYSFGKIDHGSIMLNLVVLLMAQTNWATKLALMPDRSVSRKQSAAVLGLIAICICFGMFTAGYEKALAWIDFDVSQSGFVGWWQMCFFLNDRKDFLAPLVAHFPDLLFEAFDYMAVFFELSPFVMLILGVAYWRAWLLMAGIFHLANVLFLNISFVGHVMVYGVFILPYFTYRAETLLRARTKIERYPAAGFLLMISAGILTVLVRPSLGLSSSIPVWIAYIVACAALMIAAARRDRLVLRCEPAGGSGGRVARSFADNGPGE